MPKQTRQPILNSQKAALRAQHQLKPHLSNIALKIWFETTYNQSINPSSVSRIISSDSASFDEATNRHQEKRRRTESWPELEKAIFEWTQRAEEHISISQEVIREKARQYWQTIYPGREMPSFSNGWLRGFQSRWSIRQNIQHGEAGSLSQDAGAEMARICQVLSTYAPQDIYNCDETSLYWRKIPDRSLSTRSLPGRKKDKARISILFCCNSDASERIPVWFIGTARRPKAFVTAGINIENLGCVWRSNKKAWMTGEIFKEWLIWFDKKMAGRKVVLLLDNFSAHEAAFRDIGPQLQNTLVIWLPCNSTTRYQPLDQGVIRTWKAYWRRQWVLFMMDQFDKGYDPLSTMTILQAVRWAISAWNLDLAEDTIQNCFKKAFSSEDTREIRCQAVINEITCGIQQLQVSNNIQDAMDIHQFLNPEEEQVDDSLATADDLILSQFSSASMPEEEEEEEENCESLPQISIIDALESLYKLRLFEEQQVDGNKALIQQLLFHERTLLRKKVSRQQQSDIRDFFCN